MTRSSRIPVRCAGTLVPLFSISSETSWGIGEIADLPRLASWCAKAGLSFVQLLPIHEMPEHETSPYSALSAMAIDPQFIALSQVEDFEALGGEPGLAEEERRHLDDARDASRVAYDVVRRLKARVLRRCFDRFVTNEIAACSHRAEDFARYVEEERWWLDDYALFRALREQHGRVGWTEWPAPLAAREPEALNEARRTLASEMRYRQYLQWIADGQWSEARRACGAVELFGDLPFMVGTDSADVWSRQSMFDRTVSVGVPPDAFSETGQDWQLPLYRWDAMEAEDFGWLRARARRYAALYSGYRIDHLVGFYRTYYRPRDGSSAAFSPPTEDAQTRLGEQVLAIFAGTGARVIAEDLGVIPDFVRASLDRLQLPGYKVFRWEREWHQEGQPFKDPVDYARTSVATSGTHDTEPMALWWEGASVEERGAVLATPSVRRRLGNGDAQVARDTGQLTPALHAALLEVLYASGSDLLILPIQDAFNWRDRINQPATIGPANWTWRLPWPVERLRTQPEGVAVARGLRSWAERHHRLP